MSFGETLDALVDEGAVAWGLLLAGLIVVALTPLVIRLAPLIGGVDTPGREGRARVHRNPIPRIGGLAIAAGLPLAKPPFVDPHGPVGGNAGRKPDGAPIGALADIPRLSGNKKALGGTGARRHPAPRYATDCL